MLNRFDWIGRQAYYFPEKWAFSEHETGRSFTYGALHRAGEALAAYLTTEKGLRPGDRCAVLAENSAEHFVLYAAACKTGIIIVPLNYRLTERELAEQITLVEPSLFITGEAFKSKINASSIPLETLLEASTPFSTKEYPAYAPQENDALFILFTSGSTGVPKGVIYTYKMAFWNSLNTALRLDLTSLDVTLNVMPLFHTGGFNVFVIPFFHFGGAFVSFQKFDPLAILRTLEAKNCTIFMGVPTMLQMMARLPEFADARFPAMRYALVGGEPCPVPLIEEWAAKGVPIRQGYGMTEAGPNLTSLHQDDALRKKGSIGTPNFYIDARILDDDDKIIDGAGTGELLIGGPVVTPGYFRNPEETAANLTPDGFLKTGDVVRRDEEGYLYVVDRKKNMYISGGENVYPAEVERALYNAPGVRAAVVVSVPDGKWGEAGKAFIVPAEAPPTVEQLISYCKTTLAGYKIPKYFVFVQDLPKNDAGKIDRKVLKNFV